MIEMHLFFFSGGATVKTAAVVLQDAEKVWLSKTYIIT